MNNNISLNETKVLFDLLAESGKTQKQLFEDRFDVKFRNENNDKLRINSPLREDKNPSCDLVLKDGDCFLRDYNLSFPGKNPGDKLNYINIVQWDNGFLEKGGYYKAIDFIAEKFGVKEEYQSSCFTLKMEALGASKLQLGKEVVYTKKFSEAELQYWLQFGITLDILSRNNVKSLAGFVIGTHNSKNLISSNSSNPMFAYLGKSFAKIYQPFSAKYKFRSLGEFPDVYYFGSPNFDPNLATVVAAGQKDCMALQAMGFNSIAMNSETAAIPKDTLNKFKYNDLPLAILYDNDDTGKKYGKLRAEEHGLALVELPQLPNVKDVADYVKMGHSIEELKTLIFSAIKKLEDEREGSNHWRFVSDSTVQSSESDKNSEIMISTENYGNVMDLIAAQFPFFDGDLGSMTRRNVIRSHEDLLNYLDDIEEKKEEQLATIIERQGNGSKITLPEYVYPRKKLEREVLISTNGSCLLSVGNFAVISGAPKSYKSTFINTIVRSFLTPVDERTDEFGVDTTQLEQPQHIVSVDTEQSRYDFFEKCDFLMQALGVEKVPNNYRSFHARSFQPEFICNQIKEILEELKSVKVLIIDGIADLINSVNDEFEANRIGSMLTNWADKYNIGILVVIHDNQSNNRARGHLGSMLQRKAESFLRLSVKEEAIMLSFDFCRNAPIMNDIELKLNRETRFLELATFSGSEYYSSKDLTLLKACFDTDAVLDYSTLVKRIMTYKHVKESAAKKQARNLKDKGLMLKTEEGKYTLAVTPKKETTLAEASN